MPADKKRSFPLSLPAKMRKKLHEHNGSMQFFLFLI